LVLLEDSGQRRAAGGNSDTLFDPVELGCGWIRELLSDGDIGLLRMLAFPMNAPAPIRAQPPRAFNGEARVASLEPRVD
jgi:hypothetical protein